jgi:FKBP-type peptidyl-prolyl cis-trans isomerase
MARRSLVLVLLFALPLLAAPEKPAAPADLNDPPADAQRLESGLITKQLAAGSGTVHPKPEDMVRVRYTVWKDDGTLVQHVLPGVTAMLPISKMLPGWAEALRMMVAGETRRAWVPASLTAGKGHAFVFDTELVEIIEPPVTPPDVTAPPADATTTESGLAYKVLRPGTGSVRPRKRDTVVVHYSGWTTDGRMFDSSVMRGQTTEFPLDGVIRGWTEGLQLMVEGEKTRFWIPSKLAYGNDKTKPQGMLVFDVELVKIK